DGRLAPGDPEAVEVVRWLYATYLHGDIGVKKLASLLEKRGVKPPSRKNRKGWTDDAVHIILTNPAYKGTLRYNFVTAGKYHRLRDGQPVEHFPPRRAKGGVKVTRTDPAEVITTDGAHEAVIDPATWEAVQRKLDARRTQHVTVRNRETYP